MTWVLAVLAIIAALLLADRLLWPRQSEPKEPPDVVGAQVIQRGAAGGAYGLPWSADDGRPIDNTTVYPPDHDHKAAIPITLTMKDVMGHDEYYKWLESLKG